MTSQSIDFSNHDYSKIQNTTRALVRRRGFDQYAEDAAQEVVLRTLEKQASFNPDKGEIGAFAYAIARSEVIDAVKRWDRPVYTPIRRKLEQEPRRHTSREDSDRTAEDFLESARHHQAEDVVEEPSLIEREQLFGYVMELLTSKFSEQEARLVFEVWLNPNDEQHPMHVIAQREGLPSDSVWRLVHRAQAQLANNQALKALLGAGMALPVPRRQKAPVVIVAPRIAAPVIQELPAPVIVVAPEVRIVKVKPEQLQLILPSAPIMEVPRLATRAVRWSVPARKGTRPALRTDFRGRHHGDWYNATERASR